MKQKGKSVICLLLAAAMMLTLMAGCGGAPTGGATDNGETVKEEKILFTDSTGREVELPADISRVACGGSLANIVICAVAPEKIVGWATSPSELAKKYMDESLWDLPEYGLFYDSSENFNREALMASNAQVILDVGEWDEEYKAELDALQEQIGIPVVLIESDLDLTPQTYRTVGQLLGNPERGEQLAAYCEEVLADAREKSASIPAGEKIGVYFGEGESGLFTMLGGTIHSQIYELVGAEIVATADNVQVQRGGGNVSMEQLMAWDPDVIMFPQGSIYDQVENDATWGALRAVREGRYYEIPSEPYNWLGRPPGPNRILGIRWLGNLFYPEIFDYDMEQEVKEYFSLFYRYELTDEEVERLLGSSTLKADN